MMDSTAHRNASIVRTYIRAKDDNKPHLARQIFSASSFVRVSWDRSLLPYPSELIGADDITTLLCQEFNQRFENIYTFCLSHPPDNTGSNIFHCPWLTTMTARKGAEVYVGCGTYEWLFTYNESAKVNQLAISTDHMIRLKPRHQNEVLDWLGQAQYPWGNVGELLGTMPRLESLIAIQDWLHGQMGGQQ
ncbi:hypothetical protein HBA55_28785 [Pseudomaricurvus alkylphenolicus]|uniref:hypothetical protein n=1 Tax=Pseudomaricurvus alkylphenolicus TaxID=1306991 RepID=UPI001423EDE9|nr:hypothetical protein [Pseudomaricurvus alkylphenolicus]NIB43639.1 hypothetical protein [Pseudomaricurvus alkylphenolicus]